MKLEICDINAWSARLGLNLDSKSSSRLAGITALLTLQTVRPQHQSLNSSQLQVILHT